MALLSFSLIRLLFVQIDHREIITLYHQCDWNDFLYRHGWCLTLVVDILQSISEFLVNSMFVTIVCSETRCGLLGHSNGTSTSFIYRINRRCIRLENLGYSPSDYSTSECRYILHGLGKTEDRCELIFSIANRTIQICFFQEILIPFPFGDHFLSPMNIPNVKTSVELMSPFN